LADYDSALSRYEALKQKRDPFLRRARECAELTIPALLPPEGHSDATLLPEPYSGLGARAVVSLASRLMVAMYPPAKPSFRLDIPTEVRIQSGNMDVGSDVEQGLILSEALIQAEIERREWRPVTNLVLQYLIVTGNALELMMPDNSLRVFRLDQYVISRDMQGRVREIITEEYLAPESLPDAMKNMVTAEDYSGGRVRILTHVMRQKDGTFKAYQEVNKKKVAGSEGIYETMPYNALTWTTVIGEDYGRGKVEEHLPDFRGVDALSKSMLDGAAMASRNVTMIRPNAAGGLNLRRRLAKANNGEIIVGNPEDIAMLQFQNQAGLQLTAAELDRQSRELGLAFLLGSSTVRDSERTTAYEIQRNQEELEGALGGVFSQLNQTMQARRLRRLIVQMRANAQLPNWPEGMVEPTILTGLEALGREADVTRVQSALMFLQGMPPDVLAYVKWTELLGKAFYGLNLPDAVRTEAEMQQVQQQQAMMQAGQQAMAAGGSELATQAAQQAMAATAQG
jgi:hypothetical protein